MDIRQFRETLIDCDIPQVLYYKDELNRLKTVPSNRLFGDMSSYDNCSIVSIQMLSDKILINIDSANMYNRYAGYTGSAMKAYKANLDPKITNTNENKPVKPIYLNEFDKTLIKTNITINVYDGTEQLETNDIIVQAAPIDYIYLDHTEKTIYIYLIPSKKEEKEKQTEPEVKPKNIKKPEPASKVIEEPESNDYDEPDDIPDDEPDDEPDGYENRDYPDEPPDDEPPEDPI